MLFEWHERLYSYSPTQPAPAGDSLFTDHHLFPNYSRLWQLVSVHCAYAQHSISTASEVRVGTNDFFSDTRYTLVLLHRCISCCVNQDYQKWTTYNQWYFSIGLSSTLN